MAESGYIYTLVSLPFIMSLITPAPSCGAIASHAKPAIESGLEGGAQGSVRIAPATRHKLLGAIDAIRTRNLIGERICPKPGS